MGSIPGSGIYQKGLAASTNLVSQPVGAVTILTACEVVCWILSQEPADILDARHFGPFPHPESRFSVARAGGRGRGAGGGGAGVGKGTAAAGRGGQGWGYGCGQGWAKTG